MTVKVHGCHHHSATDWRCVGNWPVLPCLANPKNKTSSDRNGRKTTQSFQ